MYILPFLSVLFFTSAPMHESRQATIVSSGQVEVSVRSEVSLDGFVSEALSSVADTSGESSKERKRQREDLSSADLKARQSRTMGILALGTIGLGLLLPVLLAGAVPLGILAIVKGSQAQKEGSRMREGKVMGIIALSLILLGLLMVIGFLATPGFF